MERKPVNVDVSYKATLMVGFETAGWVIGGELATGIIESIELKKDNIVRSASFCSVEDKEGLSFFSLL